MAAPPEIARENGKKGGRPKGRKNDATLKREAVLKAMQQRILKATDVLLDRQMHLASGVSYLFKIEKYWKVTGKGKGKKKTLMSKKPVIVTDPEEIRAYIEGKEFPDENKKEGDPTDTYYFITTEKPDNKAIADMFNRTYGRSVTPVALVDDDGKSIFDDDKKKKTNKVVGSFLGGKKGNTANTGRRKSK